MPVIKYVGPHAEVDVPDLGVVVKSGDTIEVTAEQAEGLLCQESNWKKSTKSAVSAEKEA